MGNGPTGCRGDPLVALVVTAAVHEKDDAHCVRLSTCGRSGGHGGPPLRITAVSASTGDVSTCGRRSGTGRRPYDVLDGSPRPGLGEGSGVRAVKLAGYEYEDAIPLPPKSDFGIGIIKRHDRFALRLPGRARRYAAVPVEPGAARMARSIAFDPVDPGRVYRADGVADGVDSDGRRAGRRRRR